MAVIIDNNVRGDVRVMGDSVLMVCLCDLTADGYINAEPLGSVQVCDKHGVASVKLQSLIERDIKCCLHAIDDIGDVRPLHIKKPDKV